MTMQARIQKAQELGLSVKSTTQGTLTTWTIRIPDLQTFREVLQAGTTPTSREERVKKMFTGVPPAAAAEADGTVAGTLHRVQMYLFGNAELSTQDAKRAASQFPQDYTIVSGTPNGPIKGEWCLGTQQGLQTYDLTTLDLEDGGYITVYNTPIEFTVDTLTRNGAPPPGVSDFNVYGFTGNTGSVGAAVSAGTAGSPGGPGTCTVSGSEAGDNGGNGSTGTNGVAGNAGGTGGAGFPSCSADITINALVGQAATLSVFTQSGTGGAGGAGGTGAAGGTGGDGGNGATCECTGTSGGRGGDGGNGGTGGIGGPGGVGANASGNVTVTVPSSLLGSIVHQSALAPPGPGGPGGAPGQGGTYGNGGQGGKGHGSPGKGSTGNTGQTGATGPAGTTSGQPGKIIVSSA